MRHNVGNIDRVLRMLLGAALLSILFLVEGPARWWGLLGFVPVVTALAGFCPLYALMGLNTCPRSPAPR